MYDLLSKGGPGEVNTNETAVALLDPMTANRERKPYAQIVERAFLPRSSVEVAPVL